MRLSKVKPSVTAPRSLELSGHGDIKIRLLEWGTQGPTLLFVHGYASTAASWQPVAARLSSHFRCLAMDLRGHGGSGRSPGCYGTAFHVADLHRITSQLDIESLTLVGHSWGGRISAEVAASKDVLIRRLVLAEPVVRDKNNELLGEMLARLPKQTYSCPEEYAEALRAWYPLTSNSTLRSIAQASAETSGDSFVPVDPILFSTPNISCRGRPDPTLPRLESDFASLCQRIRCSTLVVRGQYSSFLNLAEAQCLTDHLQTGSLAVIQRAGHGLMLDNPRDLVDTLKEFLD